MIHLPHTDYPYEPTCSIPRSCIESMKEIRFRPIGIVHSPFTTPCEAPRQPHFSAGAQGSITVFPEYEDGLKDLEGFSHIILLCHLHLSTGYSLHVTPGWDGNRHGLFATRTPRRPNPIGISVVRLKTIEGNTPGNEMRTTKIERVEEVDNKLIIQGAEQGREGVRAGLAGP